MPTRGNPVGGEAYKPQWMKDADAARLASEPVTFPFANLDEVQSGRLTVTYGDESVTLDPSMAPPEFQQAYRRIEYLLVRARTAHAIKETVRRQR